MDGAEFGVAARAEYAEPALRHPCDFVAVRHPDLRLRRNADEQFTGLRDFEDRLAVFARSAAGDLSAERLNHELQPVTDAEDRNAEFEDGRIALRRVFGINTRRAAGQDDALRALRPDGFGRRVERHDPAVHPAFTNPPRDQLTVLGAEIEDDDRFTHRGGFSFAKDGFLILFR